MLERPSYHWPAVRNVAIGLGQRVVIFMRRVGGTIMLPTMALWLLSSFPGLPRGTGAGRWLTPHFMV